MSRARNWASAQLAGLVTQPVWIAGPGVVTLTPPLARAPATPPPPPLPGHPLWRRAATARRWIEIPGSSVAAGQSPTNVARRLDGVGAVVGLGARMDAWCGLSIDTRSSKVWSVANGGHGDYYGNEVATIDLMSDTPRWIEWCAGSSGNVVDNVTLASDPSHARYKDGLPCSTHSYYGQQFIERHNRAIRLGGSTAPVGSAFENVESFDVSKRTTNGWDAAGTYGMCLGGVNGGWTSGIGWCACKDPRTEEIYVTNAPFVRRFTPGQVLGGVWNQRWSRMPDALNTGAQGATAIDTTRNRLVWLKGYGPNTPYSCDLTTGTWTQRQYADGLHRTAFERLGYLPKTGEESHQREVGWTSAWGMVYAPGIDRFLLRDGFAGPRIWVMHPETFAISLLDVTGGETLPGTLRKGTPTSEEDVLNRIMLVPALDGLAYFPRAGANVWFLPLN